MKHFFLYKKLYQNLHMVILSIMTMTMTMMLIFFKVCIMCYKLSIYRCRIEHNVEHNTTEWNLQIYLSTELKQDTPWVYPYVLWIDHTATWQYRDRTVSHYDCQCVAIVKRNTKTQLTNLMLITA